MPRVYAPSQSKPKKTEIVWGNLRKKPSTRASAIDSLVENNLGLVHMVAHRMAAAMRGQQSTEELAQVGAIGLVKAAQRYDETRGKFSTFAVRWIKGEILHYLRDHGTLIKIPQTWRSKFAQGKKWRQRLETNHDERVGMLLAAAHGRSPSSVSSWEYKPPWYVVQEGEVCYRVDEGMIAIAPTVSDGEVAFSIGLELSQWLSIKEAIGHSLSPYDPAIDGDRSYEDEPTEDYSELRDRVSKLPEQEGRAIALVYFEGLTPYQASRQMEVTPQVVQGLMERAIASLRVKADVVKPVPESIPAEVIVLVQPKRREVFVQLSLFG